MKDILAIVGSHTRTRDEFDFTRTDCDVWVFNEAMNWAKRADAVFQLHDPIIWRNPLNRNDPGHFAWLTSGKTPTVYMQEQYSEVPKAQKYPLDDILNLTNLSRKFLTSSVAEALALGILQGYKAIEVWGVAMETDTEYRYQRDGVAYWLGVADGKGVKISFIDGTFDGLIYGYEGEVALDYQLIVNRAAELVTDKSAFTDATEAAHAGYLAFVKAGGMDAAKQFIPLLQAQVKEGQAIAKIDGARQENQRYIGKADAMRETSGGFIFSRQEFEAGASTAQKESAKYAEAAIKAGGRVDMMYSAIAQTKDAKNRRRKSPEFLAALNQYVNLAMMAALHEGVFDENIRYLGILDKHIRAAGGERSEVVMLERLQNA